ncbi:MAG: hypothetical protein K940chlam3_01677 [Chlamydiae bacterium]|nr:hypothetical protein [Chlamydiota bacterium]
MGSTPKDFFQLPYILHEYDQEACQKLLREKKDDPIWSIARLTFRPETAIKGEKMVIPIEIATASRGFTVECMKIYLVGQNLLVLSVLDPFPTKRKGVGKISNQIELKRPTEMEMGMKYDFMHFIINHGHENYKDLNSPHEMQVCYVKDEEEFCKHLNLCVRDPDYIKDLRNLLIRKKENETFIELTDEKDPPEEPSTTWGWTTNWIKPIKWIPGIVSKEKTTDP